MARRLTLRQAGQLMGCSPWTARRRLKLHLVWGQHRGQPCWLVDLRSVRAVALLEAAGEKFEEQIEAQIEVLTTHIERLGKRLIRLERRGR
jgi:hypothetical protein